MIVVAQDDATSPPHPLNSSSMVPQREISEVVDFIDKVNPKNL